MDQYGRGLPRATLSDIIGPVTRLRDFWRRTVAYNRQPRRLILLPLSIASVVLGLYGLVSGNPSMTLMWVVIGLVTFVTVVDGGMWLVQSYRTRAPKPE